MRHEFIYKYTNVRPCFEMTTDLLHVSRSVVIFIALASAGAHYSMIPKLHQ